MKSERTQVYFESAAGPQHKKEEDLVYAAVKEAIEKEKHLERLNETQQPLPSTSPTTSRVTSPGDRENEDAEPPLPQSTTETVNKHNTSNTPVSTARRGGYDSDIHIPPLVAQRMLLEHIIGSEDKLVKAATELAVKARKTNERGYYQPATNLLLLGEDERQDDTFAHAPPRISTLTNVEDELTRVVEQYAAVFHKFMVIGERQVAWHLLGRLERLIALFDGSRIEKEQHEKHQATTRSSEKVMAGGLPGNPATVRSSRVTFIEKKYQEHVSIQRAAPRLGTTPQQQGEEKESTSSDASAAIPPLLLPLNSTTMRICKTALGNLFRAYEYAQQKAPAGDGIVSQELARQRIAVQGANRLAAHQGVADPADLTLDPYLTRKMLESEDRHYPTTVAHALEKALKNSRPLSASVTRRERAEPVTKNVIANLLASESRNNRKQSELDAERSHDLPVHKKQLFNQRKFSPSSLAHSEENPHAYFLRTTSNVSTQDRDKRGGGDVGLDGVKKRPFRPSSAHATIGRSCSSLPSPSSSAAVSRTTSFQRSGTSKAKAASYGSNGGNSCSNSSAATSANTFISKKSPSPSVTSAAAVSSSPSNATPAGISISTTTCNKIDSIDAQRPRYYGKALFGPPKSAKVTGSTAVKRPHSAGVSIGGILKKNAADSCNNSKVDEAPINKNRVGGAEVGIGAGGPKPPSRPTTAGNARTNPVPRPPSVLVQTAQTAPIMGQKRSSSHAAPATTTTSTRSSDDDDTVAVCIVEDEDDNADDEALDAAFAGGGALRGASGIGSRVTDPRRPTMPAIKNDDSGAGSYGRQNKTEDGSDLRGGKQEGLCPRPPSASVGGRPDAKKDNKRSHSQTYDPEETPNDLVAEGEDNRASVAKAPPKDSDGSRPSSAALRNWCDPQLVDVYAPVKEEEAPDEGEESLIRFLRGENGAKTPVAGKADCVKHKEEATGVAPQHFSGDPDEEDVMKSIRERVARASEGLGHELVAATLSTSASSLNSNNYFHPSQKTVRDEAEAKRRGETVDHPFVSKRDKIIVGTIRQFLARRHVERLRQAAEKRCEVRAYLEEKDYWAGELPNDTADDLLAIAYFEKQTDAHTAKIEGINMHFRFQRKLTKIIARVSMGAGCGTSSVKQASVEESDSDGSLSSDPSLNESQKLAGDVGSCGVGLYARRPSTQINLGHIKGTCQDDEEASSSPRSSLTAASSESSPVPPEGERTTQKNANNSNDRIRGMNLGYSSSYMYPKTPSRDEGEVYRAYVAELQRDAWRLLHSEDSVGGGVSAAKSEAGAGRSQENEIEKSKVELKKPDAPSPRVVLVAGVDIRPKQATTINRSSGSQEIPMRSEAASGLRPIYSAAPPPPRPPLPSGDLPMRTADPSVESTSRHGIGSQLPTSATSADRPRHRASKKKINTDGGATSFPSSVSYERQSEPYDGRYSSNPNTKAFEEEMLLASEAMADLRRAMGRVL